ncbi:MAG: Asp-tRNA(Asn)/Glu-tRNA(Gln) amidotransferase subunit GatA [Gemmataceae bacterium]
MSLTQRTARELLDLQSRREVTAEKVAQAFLEAIRCRDGKVGAFLHVDEERVLAEARDVDAKRAAGQPMGKLAGLPVAIKDNLCIRGTPTTAASRILRDFRPPYNAGVIDRLRQADAILIGKTNLDEFAMGSSTENSQYQITRNPWDLSRTPGGSSGGSAAAVAAGESPLALGSDTGGSVRQPAALCGVVGLKPTYGRVSRFGLIAFGSSLDQVGPLARSVEDCALLLESVAGHDPRDATSHADAVPDYLSSLEQPQENLTIGVPAEYFAEGLDPEVERAVREALRVYEGLGARIREVRLPHSRFALAAYYVVATAEASSNLARYDGVHFGQRADSYQGLIDLYEKSRAEGFGDEVKRRIMLGTYVLSSGYRDAYYLQAMKVRRLIAQDFEKAFESCDVLAGPTSPTAAFPIGERTQDPLSMYLADIYTISANLTGYPASGVPCGFRSDQLPIGLQLTGRPMDEAKLLRVARMHERTTDWHTRKPALAMD